MSDFFEFDFIKLESSKSADAITMRYSSNGRTYIHITDGGYQDSGENIIEHIDSYYNSPSVIDSVVITHPDGDHAGGIIKILENYKVSELWMLCPWNYADEIIDRFKRYTNVDNLKQKLKEIYPNIATLEEIANNKGIVIYEPFQNNKIGPFIVTAPTKSRYLELIVSSVKTPDEIIEDLSFSNIMTTFLSESVKKAASIVRAAWGEEYFPEEGTSNENEMSVIQFTELFDEKILLTGDAGRDALNETIEYLQSIDIVLPGIDRIQVPHHGSRHNVSSEILDNLLGKRLEEKPKENDDKFTAIISASDNDDDHPRKSVIRAFIHRGAKVYTTEKSTLQSHYKAPKRDGWSGANKLDYPEEQEE